MIRTRSKLVLLALAGAFAFIIGASPNLIARAPSKALDVLQDPPPPPAQDPEANPGRGGRGGQAAAPRPYAQVITSAAKTDEGIFKVHRVADTLYYEIPKAELGKDFLWNTQIKKTTIGAGFGGQIVSSRVVRWVQKGDRVLLQSIDYSVVADPKDPVAMAVEDSNYPSIIRTLPVAAYAPSGDPVIDVTAFFMTDVPEFSARGAVGGRGLATDRSFLERAVSFPGNINVEATLTYTAGAADPAAGGGGGRGGGGRGIRGPSGTVVVHHSLMKLPERALMPRYYDQRVGFFTQQLVDFGTAEHRSVQKQFIKRFRLEKKDANAAVSDPVQPIVFYIDPATPKQWVASVRKGIESWQPAFEMAGFRNAIVARDAPAGDAEWSAEDARYSVVRWLPAPEEAADEPPAHDPRSGEILKAEIPAYPDMANFGTNWYVVQAGPADKRVQKLPLPDEIMGELIRYTVSHQIGHALGLQHNMKASSSYTIAQIRDPKWVKDMGFTPSIMDNTRFHYVAQPEDGIDPADLIPKVGPYDKWAIRWGYAPVPGAATSDAEESQLDRWAREQDDKPYLRFSTDGQAGTDPGDGPEAVGNADAVAATTLGLKNLVRVSDMLLAFTGTKTGDPWDDLETLYGRMASQWSTEMSQVVRVVGGIESQQTHIGQAGLRFRTVPRLRQQQALQFLLNNAFTTPAFMIKPEILRRIQPSGIVQRIRTAQTTLLASLLENSRLDRMAEQFTIDGVVAYPPLQFLTDLRAGLWSELRTPGAPVDIYRRNVQRAYLDQLDARLYGTPASSDETRSLVKGELRALDRQLQTAAAAPGLDETTRRHYLDAREAIATTLDPRVPRPAPAAGAAAGRGGRGGVASIAPGRVTGQVPPAQDPPDPAAGRGGRGGQGGQGGAAPRPYAQVITSAAKTEPGVFKVHRIGDTLYYEIPKSELGKDFLWNTQLKKTTIGAGYGGQTVGSRVVRWVARGDRVLLLNVEYTLVADAASPLNETANYPAIIRTFNVAAYAPNGDPVIDVTPIFITDVPEFSGRGRVGGRGMDASRTFLERAVAFPQNINVEVTATYTSAAADPSAAAPAGGGRGGGARAMSPTVLVHHSMVKLPETPMMPRLFDERVGYFTQGLTDYGTGERQAAPTRYITRYRLEKKDPSAAISDPVKPIIYWVDPATPKKWVPYVIKGIEDWQPAFEAAGFRKGIIAMEAPANDPTWSGEDARYSVIRWLPSTTENAVGPHVHDPRSGEILEADVQFYHNVQNLGKNWYFVQSGPLDPRAQTLPLPDDLMGELIRYVVAHEVGHTLGFQHNMKASSTYTIEQVRDPKWVKENGHTPTLMDYSRFNYVAQPEDGIAVADLIPKIGPYDKWATMWGYKPIPGARTPQEEKKTLDAWAREQDVKPYLRFSTEGQGGTDPGDNTEAVGDIDAVRATTLGLKNLGRISEMLLKATSTKTGDPWSELAEVYNRMVGQWTTELGHVTRIIGGIDSQQKHIGQSGVRFTTVPKARQVDALQFLLSNAFQTPSFMIRPEILRRIQPTGIINRVRTAQAGILGQLLQSAKLDRMAEQAALDGALAYSPLQFMGDLRAGIWGELAKPGAAISIYRRNLHRSYLNNMDTLVNGSPSDEVRALARGELRALDRQLQAALPGVTDELTRRHVIDCRDEIATILDPLVPRPAPAAGLPFGGRGGIRR